MDQLALSHVPHDNMRGMLKRLSPVLLFAPLLLAAGCQSGQDKPEAAFPGEAQAYIAPLSGIAGEKPLSFNLVRADNTVTGSFETASGTSRLSGIIIGSPTGTQGVDIGFYSHEEYGDFGHFVGQWADGKLSGTWTEGTSSASTSFERITEPDSVELAIQSLSETAKDASSTERCEFSHAVPLVQDRPEINHLIDQRFGLENVSGTRKSLEDQKKDFFDTCLADLKDFYGEDEPPSEMMFSDMQSFSVELNRSHLLSFSITSYAYSGGAHGLPGLDSFNADMQTGKPLVIGDLIKADRLQELQKMVAKKILDEYSDALFDESRIAFQAALDDKTELTPDIQKRLYGNNGSFFLTPSGITFYWNVYDITPYAAGQPQIFFSYDELKDLINPDGPLASI